MKLNPSFGASDLMFWDVKKPDVYHVYLKEDPQGVSEERKKEIEDRVVQRFGGPFHSRISHISQDEYNRLARQPVEQTLKPTKSADHVAFSGR